MSAAFYIVAYVVTGALLSGIYIGVTNYTHARDFGGPKDWDRDPEGPLIATFLVFLWPIVAPAALVYRIAMAASTAMGEKARREREERRKREAEIDRIIAEQRL